MSEYQKLTVVKLKELLKDRGLPVAGKKADLIERLEENDAQTESPSRQLPNAETGNAVDASVNNGEEVSQPPLETEATKEPVAQIPEPVTAPEEESQSPTEKETNEAPTATRTSESVAVNEAPEESPLAEAQLPNDDQKETEATMDTQDDIADVVEKSAKLQAIQEIQPSAPSRRRVREPADKIADETAQEMADEIAQEMADEMADKMADEMADEIAQEMADKMADGIVGSWQDDARDASTETVQEIKQETRRPTSDSQAMPAPELPASQIPRPSIETQQIQEPQYDSHAVEPNSGMEGITRTATMSSVNTQELLEDRKKRKRRSHSPPMSSTEVAIKKAKAIDGSPRATLVEDGLDILPARNSLEAEAEKKHDHAGVQSPDSKQIIAKNYDRDLSLVDDEAQKAKLQPENEDQLGASSKYSPTKCLYISNLMRPLQPNALRAHLEKLASLGTEDDPETVGLFFLESTRRYGMASFSSVAAANRARLGLHDRVWPDESNRKALFVDFIPESTANELIEMEEDNANKPRLERKRFEILYMERNGKVIPEIHNADSPIAIQHRAGQTSSSSASANQQKPAMKSTLPPPPREETGKNFKALDDLFPSTITKPRLYYLPSSNEVAEKRLAVLSRATMREEPRKPSSISEEKRRYTFEDGNIVDKGPEFGFGRGGNATRGRAGGFAERGSYRGRGRGGPRSDFRSGAGIGYHDRW